MLHANLRSLLAHKLRLALTALSVVLGVAFVAGTFVLTDTLNQSFTNLFSEITAKTAVVVRAEAVLDTATDPGDENRGPVPESLLADVAGVPGVAEAAGDVSGLAQLVRPDGKVVKTAGAPTLGVTWSESDLSSLHLADGRGPERSGEIAIDRGTADREKLKVGDTVGVLTAKAPSQAQIVGIFTFGDRNSLIGATLTAFDLRTAQELIGTPGEVNQIALAAKPGVSQSELAKRVQQVLPSGYEAVTGHQVAKEGSDSVKKALSFLSTFLLIFAGIAVFVSSFIIVNTFSMLVAQRTRELALLRAVGASRRQVVLSVLTEALAVGLLASTLGLGAGFLVAKGLVTVMGFIGLDIGGNGLVFAGRTAVAAYVVGILVTLLAALGPARRAAKVPPVAALRDDVALPERSLRRRAVIGLVGSVVGAIAMVGGLAGSGSSSAALVGFGALLVFIGVAALNPFISRPVVAVLGAPLPRLFGTPGRLSRENARRNPRRTAATAAALMIGMALVSTMSVLGASAKTSVSKIVEDSAGASFVLQSSMPAPFSTEVAKTLEGQPGVAEVASLRLGQAKVDGKLVNLNAWTPSAAKQALKLQMVSGKYDALGSGQLLVTQSTAKAKGWTVGQTLDVTYPNPKAPHGKLQIGGIYKDNQLAGRYMVSTAVFEEHFNANQQLDFVVLVDAKPGTDLSVLRHTVETSVKAYPNIEVKDQQEFINATKKQVDQLLNIIYALLALAIVIAVLGIVNTLALSVIERTREIGLLRAVGMSRRQLRRMVRLESVVIAVFGALLGISLGILFGAALVRASKGEGITELVIPVGQLVGYVIAAGVVGVLAALWPARRAAKLNVLKAIATD